MGPRATALLLPLLALLSSCDSCLPEGFRATPKAGFVRVAGDIHKRCVEDHPCQFVSQCHRESEARCLNAGYEKGCADLDVEGSCGVNVK